MILVCPICNKEFNAYPSRIAKAKSPVCCSIECASIQKKQASLNCTCSFCGKRFHKKQSHQDKSVYHYCSVECAGAHRKIIYLGNNNPNSFCRIEEGHRRIHCGYYWIYLPSHPLSTKEGYIREHRYIAEQYLLTEENRIEIDGKYYLSPDYDVHHIDFDKLNNDVSNLMILTRSEHSKLHGEIRKKH